MPARFVTYKCKGEQCRPQSLALPQGLRADASIGPYSDEMTVFVRVDVRICPHNAKKTQPKLNVT